MVESPFMSPKKLKEKGLAQNTYIFFDAQAVDIIFKSFKSSISWNMCRVNVL